MSRHQDIPLQGSPRSRALLSRADPRPPTTRVSFVTRRQRSGHGARPAGAQPETGTSTNRMGVLPSVTDVDPSGTSTTTVSEPRSGQTTLTTDVVPDASEPTAASARTFRAEIS